MGTHFHYLIPVIAPILYQIILSPPKEFKMVNDIRKWEEHGIWKQKV